MSRVHRTSANPAANNSAANNAALGNKTVADSVVTPYSDTVVLRCADLSQPLDYQPVWDAMRCFTDSRTQETPDEIWLLTHKPVFTQGQAGKPEHVLNPGDIPVIQIDRGGQVTYHGPGQLIAYLMIDVRRSGLGVRELVERIERSVIDVLDMYGIAAVNQRKAPGVYVNDAKIAALGLRIRHGCSYHGLSLNIGMDLSPFARINPCGYQGMEVTQLSELLTSASDATTLMNQTAQRLADVLTATLGYSEQRRATISVS